MSLRLELMVTAAVIALTIGSSARAQESNDCPRIQRSAADALANGMSASGLDSKKFLDAFRQELSRRGLARAEIRRCYPALDLFLKKTEQCAASGDRECSFSPKESAEIKKLIPVPPKSVCGALADLQDAAKEAVARLRREHVASWWSELSLSGVLDAFVSRLREAGYDVRKRVDEAARTADLDTWEACLPDFRALMDEARQKKADAANAQRQAEIEASDLPPCDAEGVQQLLLKTMQGDRVLFAPKDLRSNRNDMRWCSATLVLPYPGIGGSFAYVTYTLEFINKSEGRYWLQVKSSRRCVPQQEWRSASDRRIMGPGSCR